MLTGSSIRSGMNAPPPTFFDTVWVLTMTTCDGTMTYEEFEWHILRLVYEEGLDQLEPSYLAYALGLTHDQVNDYLEQAATNGLLEMEVRSDGRIEYEIPGLDRGADLPSPIWKDIEEQFDLDRPDDAEVPAARSDDEQPAAKSAAPAPGTDATANTPAETTAARTETANTAPAVDRPDPASARRRLQVAEHPQLPSTLREHIEARYSTADTSMVPYEQQSPIVGTEASVDDPTSRAMSALDDDRHFPFRIETTDDTYCDPTQTVFMRQIRVHGVDSEEELRRHVQRLFESFGYRIVQAQDERLRFERGSVTFILALVPLFVLVLPLFVYLFLYCMGRSTIHQEPVELDVQFRKEVEDGEPVYEIDLTFIGLHGVVLGAADQRVLNQEIDTLSDELRWSLSPG